MAANATSARKDNSYGDWALAAADALTEYVSSKVSQRDLILLFTGLASITIVVGISYMLLSSSRAWGQGEAPTVGQRVATASAQLSNMARSSSGRTKVGHAIQSAARSPVADPIGSASMTLASGLPIGEFDNMRWALLRRTPAAATVYDGRGVNWEAVRGTEASGDILIPAGFVWSFNETFQGGPGYKEASGILAGGHCALATVFNAAARSAGLSTEYGRHRTPHPGYALDQSVNIYWGRDDLRVRNATGRDLEFRWELTGDQVRVHVVPRAGESGPGLASLDGATIALTYGRPKSGGWGTLGKTSIVDQAVHVAQTYGARVDEWNGDRPVAVALNPNVLMAGTSALSDTYIYHLIAEAERRGSYVMLDVQTGSKDAMQVFSGLMDKYLRENVWFDWDLEHVAGGKVDATQINALAGEYFRRRAERGYTQPGVFGFYQFEMDAVRQPSQVRFQYDNGEVMPLFDGFGGARVKLNQTNRFMGLYPGAEFGIMEFETRWGKKYDQIAAQEYLSSYPDVKIFASQ